MFNQTKVKQPEIKTGTPTSKTLIDIETMLNTKLASVQSKLDSVLMLTVAILKEQIRIRPADLDNYYATLTDLQNEIRATVEGAGEWEAYL